MFHKKQEVKEEKPEEEQQVPAVGNDSAILTEEERKLLEKHNQIHEEARQEQKRSGKFFTLDIGEKTRIIVNFIKTEMFKTKKQDGSLADQFRYYVIDKRYPDYEKQFDVYDTVSKQIDHNIENGHSEMEIKAVRNQVGGRKYVITPFEDEV